uniref:Major sperm protein n=1 Tax=Syphacia muris TaxID=451379 RepID=A0A0N5AM03_9BILA
MGKRHRKETSSKDQSEATFESKRKKRKEESTEETEVKNESTSLPTDEYDVWLIKKPKSVDIEDLAKIKFPHIGKTKTTTVKCKNESVAQLRCNFMPVNGQMLHVPTSKARTRDEAMNIRAIAEVNGVCMISKVETGNGLDTSASTGFNENLDFKIHSIRRKPLPVLRDKTAKERLKAFGVIPKKKKRTLPNLK